MVHQPNRGTKRGAGTYGKHRVTYGKHQTNPPPNPQRPKNTPQWAFGLLFFVQKQRKTPDKHLTLFKIFFFFVLPVIPSESRLTGVFLYPWNNVTPSERLLGQALIQ